MWIRARTVAQVVFLVIIVAWVSIFPFYHYKAINGRNERAEHTPPNIVEVEKADDRIAKYTGWLAAFTCALVVVSFIQIRYLIRADRTTRIVARAAELNARAAIGVKIPRLVLREIGLYEPEPYGPKGFTAKIEGGSPLPRSQISFTIYNMGETGAIMTAFCIQTFVGLKLPPVPVYKVVIPEPPGTVIEKETFHVYQPRNFFVDLDPSQIATVGAVGTAIYLWAYGFVAFRDFLGDPHEYRFCMVWRPHSIMGEPTGFAANTRIPAEYTKSY